MEKREMNRDLGDRYNARHGLVTGAGNRPYFSPAARQVEIQAGRMVKTSWARIFSECMICITCARKYPCEFCEECEKSIAENMTALHFLPKTQVVQEIISPADSPPKSGFFNWILRLRPYIVRLCARVRKIH